MTHYYQLTESRIQTPVPVHNVWAENQHRIISSLQEFFQHTKRGRERQAYAIHTSLYAPGEDDEKANRIFILQGEITTISPRLESVKQAENYFHVITSINSLF